MNKQINFVLIFSMFCICGILGLLADQARESVNVHLNIRNNLWNHYNFKSLKSKLYEIEKNHLAISFQFANQASNNSKAILPILTSNLDREISRYKKEQNTLQSEAIRSDSNFELAKRKYLIFSISFLLSFLGLIGFILHLIFKLNSFWIKIICALLLFLALGGAVYNLF